MEQKLEELRGAFNNDLALSRTSQDLEDLRIKYLGRKGELTSILRQMTGLSAEERPRFGALSNKLKNFIEEAITSKIKESGSIKVQGIDITLPGRKPRQGTVHIINQVKSDIENIFLEYVDKWGMEEVDYLRDEDGDYPVYDVMGAQFQYHIERLRNVAIDIYYTDNMKSKAKDIEKDLEKNFIPRLKRFGYNILYFGNDRNNWKESIEDYIQEEKSEITIVITKRMGLN